MQTIRTPKNREAFLDALGEGLSIAAACRRAGISRVAAYAWRNDEEEFRAAWDEAVEEGTDLLEDAAIERARDASDTLMIFLLKARRPDKFKDRAKVEHSGPNDGPIEINDVTDLDRAKALAALMARMKAQGQG